MKSEQDIENAAYALRFRLGLLPGFVDVFTAIRSHGVSLLRYPFPSKSIDGVYTRAQDQSFIAINSRRSLTRQRYTAAHELGHHVLETEPVVQILDPTVDEAGSEGADSHERAADTFAAYFLMDADTVGSLAAQGSAPLEQALIVAAKLGVSLAAAAHRLLSLGAISAEDAVTIRRTRTRLDELFLERGLETKWLPADLAFEPDDVYLQRLDRAVASGLVGERGRGEFLLPP